MTDPARLRPILRWVVLLGVIFCAGYLWSRFEVITLPEEGCSPLLRLRPGSRLWVDRRPGGIEVGDVLFFTAPDGTIGIAEVERAERDPERYWLVTDTPECPGRDSDDFGWIEASAVEGRLMMATGP